MNIKRYLLPLLLLLPVLAFSPHHLDAQTAGEMDTMLGAETVSAASMARFVLGAASLLPAGISGPEAERTAYDLAQSKGWVRAGFNDNATLKDTAFIIMRAFDLKGGALYSIFKNPRYAYREMIYQRLIPGHTDENMKVSGERLLAMLDKTIAFSGGSQ